MTLTGITKGLKNKGKDKEKETEEEKSEQWESQTPMQLEA